ncbi:MAG: MarR family transcriptional regulator [Methanosarcinales archaeon]
MKKLPPSAKLVFKVLEYRGSLTQKEIVDESFLPIRTVRYALNRLKKEGLLEVQFSFKDARKYIYSLKKFEISDVTDLVFASNQMAIDRAMEVAI